MATINEKPTLGDLQAYVTQNCQERGWDDSNELETFLLFAEEVGELAKAIRNRRGLYAEKAKMSDKHGLEEEFADVLSFLLQLANQTGVDLEQAFRDKEAVNAKRHWDR